MKLFYSPGSCSLAPHILLEEIGEPYQLHLISVAEGKTQSPKYLVINPKGRVPVLEIEEGVTLTELPAISFYLAKRYSYLELIPDNNLSEARCLEWFNWLSGTVHAVAFGQIWRPGRFVKNEKVFPQISEKGYINIREHFSLIEKKLHDRVWAVGQSYSIVDPYLLVFYRWGFRIGINMQVAYTAWTKHAERMIQRSAVNRALKMDRKNAFIYPD